MSIRRGFISALLLTGSLHAQVTELASLGGAGVQGNWSVALPFPGRFVSADGRFVVWMSDATNLVPGDTNHRADVFVRDRQVATTERVSVDTAGDQGNGHSAVYGISISADGRYVAFESASNNLVPGDTNGAREIFLRDRLSGTTQRIALTSAGFQGNGDSLFPSVSADGRFVAFTSDASNLVLGDTNGVSDTFLRDRLTGTTERISVSSTGIQGNAFSYKPEVSADGRFVVFPSAASNLVSGDVNGRVDVFVHDHWTGSTELVSISTAGAQGDQETGWASISGDGRKVVFNSDSTNLVSGDTNGYPDVFVRDLIAGTTERVSLVSDGSQSPHGAVGYSISDDGRLVVFGSGSALVPGDTNNAGDIYLRDLANGTTERMSMTTAGAQITSAYSGTISSSGDYVVFLSDFDDVAPGDTNGLADMFIHERNSNGFTPFCNPGLDNVIPCPCANPPSGPGRGCDNSSATGGASIAASGSASVSNSTLVFTSADQRSNGFSILLQATGQDPGIVFGQGVRCTSGVHRRLYVKFAAGGGIQAPQPGDPGIPARSAALGDPISAGSSRYYVVYYRDPIVLGGCQAGVTYNATNTAAIHWYW